MKRVAPPTDSLLLDMPSAAAELSISPWTLRELVMAGEIPTVDLPCPLNPRRRMRRRLIARSALAAFIAKHQGGGK